MRRAMTSLVTYILEGVVTWRRIPTTLDRVPYIRTATSGSISGNTSHKATGRAHVPSFLISSHASLDTMGK